jgi:arylsulfatase A-like enzyme
MMRNSTQAPNLLYVFADQLRADTLSYAGHPIVRTPELDRLRAEAMLFTNATVASPVCAAYRASLFTGKYASSTGMVINELRMNPNHRCIGHILGDAGYQQAYIGKWHLWANSTDHTVPANHFVPPGPDRLGFDGYWAAYNFWHNYYQAFYFEDDAMRHEVVGYEPDIQTDLAITQLHTLAQRDRPFALFLSYGTPHDPWETWNVPAQDYAAYQTAKIPWPETWSDTPDPYMDRFKDPVWWRETFKPQLIETLRVYYAMITNLDRNVARLLTALAELGLDDRTIVVFTSDHGEMFGAHGRTQKMIFYDEAVRVPFLMRWPGHIPPGASIDVCLNSPDILPTLLGLLNLPIPNAVEGMNLSHWALGQSGKAWDIPISGKMALNGAPCGIKNIPMPCTG